MPKVDMQSWTPVELRVACELPPGLTKRQAIMAIRRAIRGDDLFAVRRLLDDVPIIQHARKVRIEPI